VEEPITEIEATMLLCDAAESIGGKLYILGGGWSQVGIPLGAPMNMALAVKLSIPWDQTNRPINVRATLVTEDGQPVVLPVGPLTAEGEIELGSPPGWKPGTPLDAPLVMNFGGVSLGPGGYVWELEVDNIVKARTPFRVFSQG
jgi:hypothetical protein